MAKVYGEMLPVGGGVMWADGMVVVRSWGPGARVVSLGALTPEQRDAARAGRLWLTNCPPAGGRWGTTWRVVVRRGRRYYAAVPTHEQRAHLMAAATVYGT
jgi:hypothetical protein